MVLAVFASADVYFQFMEHGLYVATFDARYAAYMKRYRKWCKDEYARWQHSEDEVVTTNWAPAAQSVGVDEHGTAIMAGGPSDPSGITHGPNGNKPRMTIKMWRILMRQLDPIDWPQSPTEIQTICRDRGYADVSGSTAHRWFKNEKAPF